MKAWVWLTYTGNAVIVAVGAVAIWAGVEWFFLPECSDENFVRCGETLRETLTMMFIGFGLLLLGFSNIHFTRKSVRHHAKNVRKTKQ